MAAAKKRSGEAKTFTPWIISLLVGAFLVFDRGFDYLFSSWIIGSLSNPSLTSFFYWTDYASTAIIILVPFLTVYFLDKRKTLPLVFSLISAWLIGVAIKMIVARQRPFQIGFFGDYPLSLIKEKYFVWDWGFPSNHSVTALVVLPFLPKKFRIPWVVLSILIIFARVYFGMHFLSDVLAGAALGLGIALAVLRLEEGNFFRK